LKIPLRKRFKGFIAKDNNDLLTDNEKRYFYTSNTGDTVKLLVFQQEVYITNNTAFTLVLPSVAEANGLLYNITINDDGNAVTLTDAPNENYSDSENWGGDYILDSAGDYIKLLSTGSSWTVVDNGIA
jgi:hypothetical protein